MLKKDELVIRKYKLTATLCCTQWKYIFSIILLFVLASSDATVSQKHNPFQMVDVPDSISVRLEKAYGSITGCDSVNAGRNVWNLIN